MLNVTVEVTGRKKGWDGQTDSEVISYSFKEIFSREIIINMVYKFANNLSTRDLNWGDFSPFEGKIFKKNIKILKYEIL